MSRISKGKVFIPKAWRPPELPGIPNPPLADVTPATSVPQRLLSDTGSGDSSASEGSGSERTAKREDAGLLRRLPVSFPRERFIKETIQVVRFQFELDDEGNVMYLSPELHRAWDLYALFALVPSSASLDILIESLRKDNAQWQDDVEGNGLRKAFRPRPINFDLFSEMLYDIILHPNHFLPHRRPLPIFDSNTKQWLLYTSCDMALCDASGTALPPFRDPNSGVRVQPINPLLLTINAHLKFRDHKALFAYAFPTRTIQVMDKIATLAGLIYFSPTPTEGSMGSRADIAIEEEEAEERKQRNLDSAVAPPQTSSRTLRARTRSPLSSNGDGNDDRDVASASTDTEAPANSVLSLTSENLTKLDAAQAQEELEQVERILNDPFSGTEERMVLSAWLFNPDDWGANRTDAREATLISEYLITVPLILSYTRILMMRPKSPAHRVVRRAAEM
ncbi:hypothetical protein DFH09DRAFT_1272995 [Mycena vulgaris]|nr:hypothetical protein DFH09DRAFT_1272995 [Mycena vulgaris]